VREIENKKKEVVMMRDRNREGGGHDRGLQIL
jgi:hypothetical protein